ncbi:hypothetical protein T11_16891 [Trichinella zimbabwensis]|uniref:Uncharacterized protein n=1 Tax=Trichinella zimbabwensis TaxID=268475 RepID=A0A0V1GTP8_9BILA|nr:hypothetical protein T11_16891 [Trichinella zimbabwensis]
MTINEVSRCQRKFVIWSVTDDVQWVIVDPDLCLTEYSAKLVRLRKATAKDLARRYFDCPQQALPISSAPWSMLSIELSFDATDTHSKCCLTALRRLTSTFYPGGHPSALTGGR